MLLCLQIDGHAESLRLQISQRKRTRRVAEKTEVAETFGMATSRYRLAVIPLFSTMVPTPFFSVTPLPTSAPSRGRSPYTSTPTSPAKRRTRRVAKTVPRFIRAGHFAKGPIRCLPFSAPLRDRSP